MAASGSMGASLMASMDDTAYRPGADTGQDGKPENALLAALKQTPIAKGWGAYTRALETNPVRTKAITSFFGFVLGDIAAQKIGGARHCPPCVTAAVCHCRPSDQ